MSKKGKRKRQAGAPATKPAKKKQPLLPPPRKPLADRLFDDFFAPQPIVRLETLRLLIPLAILGFMSSRLIHADYWIGDAGFFVPDLGGDWRQPLYLPRLPGASAWVFAGVMVASGLSLAFGWFTRWSGLIFAATLFWVAWSDRLSAFTVSKLGAPLVFALALSPCGSRHILDFGLRRKLPDESDLPTHVSALPIRFFQATLVVMYTSSGFCKARHDWLNHTHVLWTHLHSSYQTPVTVFVANTFPTWSWTVLQGITLAFEALAPLWFCLRWTRPVALAWGLSMHAMIGLMFGPVIWFSLLMMSLLIGGFAPVRWLDRTVGRLP